MGKPHILREYSVLREAIAEEGDDDLSKLISFTVLQKSYRNSENNQLRAKPLSVCDTSSNEPLKLHFVDWAHCREMVSLNSFNKKISRLFASKPVAMLHIALLIMCSSHDYG